MFLDHGRDVIVFKGWAQTDAKAWVGGGRCNFQRWTGQEDGRGGGLEHGHGGGGGCGGGGVGGVAKRNGWCGNGSTRQQ